jgi:hypothetical protein
MTGDYSLFSSIIKASIPDTIQAMVSYWQGDQIGNFFANWAAFGGSFNFFEKMKQPKEMATF